MATPHMITDQENWVAEQARFLTRTEHSARPAGEAEIDPLATEFNNLTATVTAGTAAGVLENVVQAARDVVPGADLVSITLRGPDGSFRTPVRTGPMAEELDRLQRETGEGPCLDAARESGPAYVRSEHLGTESEWPNFGPDAARLGFHSLLTVALLPGTAPPRLPGALNIYSCRPRALLAEDREAAFLLAVQASLALAGTDARTHAELAEVQLAQPPRNTQLIDAVTELLVRRRGLLPDEAFDLLSHTVQDLNLKLAERSARPELAIQ